VPLVLEKRCSKSTHRIEIHRDGTIKLLNHDVDMLKAFTAFGAKRPRCLRVLEDWQDNPIAILLTPGLLTPREIGLIAVAWARQVAPLSWEDPFSAEEARDVERDRIVRILDSLDDFWRFLSRDATFAWDSPLESIINAGHVFLAKTISFQSGPPKEAVEAVVSTLDASWFAYRSLASGDPLGNLPIALAHLMKIAEKAQSATSWRVLMTLTERQPEYMHRIEAKTIADVVARQLYVAVRIVEKNRR
jgi:hypothetical protein